MVSLLFLGSGALWAVQEKPFTAERHKANGVNCSGCHGNGAKAAPSVEKCLSCHGSYEKLAERTKKLARNPHASHYGDLDCTLCHHGHKVDENYCGSCHH